jgi:hypothetical protein
MEEFLGIGQALVVSSPYLLVFNDPKKAFLICVVIQKLRGCLR